MKQYNYYLEPSVFLFKNDSTILLYDSDSKEKLLFAITTGLEFIVNQLSSINNLYSIIISEEDLQDVSIQEFVFKTKEKFMADIHPYSENKVVVIPPRMKSHLSDSLRKEGALVMPLINEITFYINDYCNLSCQYCNQYYKQFLNCYKNKGELSIKHIIKAINTLLMGTISIKINFVGGNIFYYSKIDALLKFVTMKKVKANFYVHYNNWNSELGEIILLTKCYFHIIVNELHNLDQEKINKLFALSSKYAHQIKFRFITTSISDINIIERLLENKPQIEYSIYPFYTTTNLDFFKENIFINQDELLEATPSKKEIYQHQTFNKYDMGKLIQTSDGRYYANLNLESIGSKNDDLIQVAAQEWNSGMSWRRIRNQTPCCYCVFQYLCPSPSNYELVMNKANLCTIIK